MRTKLSEATVATSVTEAIEAVRGTPRGTRGIATRADGIRRGERTVTVTVTVIKAGIPRDVVGRDRGSAKTESDRVADQETTKNLATKRLRVGPLVENGIRSVMAMIRIGEIVEGTGVGTGVGADTVHDEVSFHVHQ